MMAASVPQLPLDLTHPPEYGREAFFAGPSNEAALALIERWPDWPAPVAVLSGPAGAGKTHLARIWAARAGADVLAAASLGSDALADVARGSRLVVEDVPAEGIAEATLFHLINGAREAGSALLLTARLPASAWRIGLEDLRSRLRMAVPATIDAPDETLLRRVLAKLFADRQLLVDATVLDYLVLRMERSFAAATALAAALDREALAAGRGITRPMAARVLTLMAERTSHPSS